MRDKHKLVAQKVEGVVFHDFHYFVGIDVSKKKVNAAVLMQGRIVKSLELLNTPKGFKRLVKILKKLPDSQLDKVLICMESTGIYHLPLANYLTDEAVKFGVVWVENAAQIKQSMGFRRGQNDKADARNIAEYAYRHHDRLRYREADSRVYQRPCPTLIQLKTVHLQRSKLLKMKHQLQNEIKEYESFDIPEMIEIAALKKTLSQGVLDEIEGGIKICEAKMKGLVNADAELKETYQLITTVEGVGLLVSVYLIVATDNFKRFTNARKFACQIGIAPFVKQSGTSVNQKSGVSHYADKLGKKMITNAVGCAIRRYGGLRTYYERKVAEGKHESKVLNACKNKLLHRIFAVMKSGKPYNKFHQWQSQ